MAEAAQQWPEFAAAAAESAVLGYLSAPLFIDDEYHGSLNLYDTGGNSFGALDAALLELYTTAAEAALRSARRHQSARETMAQLSAALTSRAVIDQAKGILMALHRIPPTTPSSCSSRRRKSRTRSFARSPRTSSPPP